MSLSTTVADNAVISEEDALRADMYDFLASLLRKEPSDELIEKVTSWKVMIPQLVVLASL